METIQSEGEQNIPGRKLDGGNLQQKTEGNPARKGDEN